MYTMCPRHHPENLKDAVDPPSSQHLGVCTHTTHSTTLGGSRSLVSGPSVEPHVCQQSPPGESALGIKAAWASRLQPSRVAMGRPSWWLSLFPQWERVPVSMFPSLCNRQLSIEGHTPIVHGAFRSCGSDPSWDTEARFCWSFSRGGWVAGPWSHPELPGRRGSEAGLLWACRGA